MEEDELEAQQSPAVDPEVEDMPILVVGKRER